MEDIRLSEFQEDALREISGICAGNAATALSQLLNKKIEIDIPEIFFVPVENSPSLVGKDKLVVGLVVKVLGDLPSVILFVFPQKDAFSLASLLTNKKPTNGGVITELERSALKEIGIILANAYLQALTAFIRWGLVPTVPEIIEDMATALIDYILIELSNVSRYALLIKSEFREKTTKITGHFFLIPNPEGLKVLLGAIKSL